MKSTFGVLFLIGLISYSLCYDVRVQQIVKQLTLEQKVGQMTQLAIGQIVDITRTRIDPDKVRNLARNYYVGSFLQNPNSSVGPNWNTTQWINAITEIQQIFLSEGVQLPIIYALDSVHGNNNLEHATIFPQQIGAAATFNRQLVRKMGEITAKDTRLIGASWTFSPILDLATEPRWARVYETFGEDPYVVSQLGAEIIKGYQGDPIDLKNPTKVAACMKHFIGYGEPRTGQDRNPSWIPDRQLYQYFVPPFQAAIDAGVVTAMESYNDVNGEPVCASEKYLKKLIRNEMGFKGMLVTDWAEIKDLNRFHKIAPTEKDAVKITMQRTTIDMSMVPLDTGFFDDLVALVKEGVIPESRIDESVTRIIQLKEDLGLLDNPFPDPNHPLLEKIGGPEDRQAALDTCRESITLLQNDRNILPLSNQSRRILVTGPSSDSLTYLCGGWTVNWLGATTDKFFQFGTTVFEGVKMISPSSQVTHKRGCSIEGKFTNNELEDTVEAAKNSDVVILCIGEDHYAERFGDIDDLLLPEGQLQLAKSLIDTGVPVIVVLVQGRTRIFNSYLDGAAAIINAYLPGLEGGQAIAEIIFGLINPSGRLPVSYPKATGVSPLTYYHSVTEAPNFKWPFGHGLSYSKFVYSGLTLSLKEIKPSDSLDIYFTISNEGPYDGKETVLLYLSDEYREITPEVKMLKRFEKISLKAYEKTQLKFTLTLEDFTFIGIDLTRIYEPGTFIVSVGDLSQTFTLLP